MKVRRSHAWSGVLLSLAVGALGLTRPALAQTPSALDIALEHLGSRAQALGLTAQDVADKRLTSQSRTQHNGVTHLHFQQRLQGIDVANAHINVNVGADGEVLSVGNRFVAGLAGRVSAREPGIGAVEAIHRAGEQLGLVDTATLHQTGGAGGPAREARFTGGDLSLDEIPVMLAYFVTESGAVRLSWEMNIRQVDQKHWWNLWVDAESGEILGRVDWIANDSYEVFALPKESPADGSRTIESNPADATASPYGWHDDDGIAGAEYTDTRGNNVFAQEDRDGNNVGGTRPSGGTTRDFQFGLDLANAPVTYQDAAITNLFYWNNVMHDLLYQYGFDEANGNFQRNSYGRGGSGGDEVNADAQDGSGTDNANFATPPDGQNPRMQMYEWTPPFVNELVVDAPSSAAGSYFGSDAAFGPALGATGVSGSIVAVDDGTAPGSDGCQSLTPGSLTGGLALIDRGDCSFVTKVRNAQGAGAAGVVIANNVAGNPIGLGDDGTGGDITIPSMMISQSDGQTVRGGLPASGTQRAVSNPPPNRDSDLDAGIIAHEYCHGLSNRLTGGPNNVNCLSGSQQAGEGWSDLCTLFFTADAADTATTPRGVGTYSMFEAADGLGIRPYRYSTDLAENPLTYGDLTTGSLTIPHGVGTVWATAVWEMYWNLVAKHGFDADLYSGTGGNNLAIQLMVDGLKLQGCNPTFLDARDAILLADQTNNAGDNECEIWSAFAKRGMGASAGDGGSASSLNVTESFDLPAQCVQGCGNGICEEGEDCNSCPSDCVAGSGSGAECGNGVCETGNGEDCLSCPSDCAGKQNGKPGNRYCCGDGDGAGPVSCADSRCTAGGLSCTDVPAPGGTYCCGDATCDAGESCDNCALDCTLGPELCGSGIDEDCDGAVDCADGECSALPVCEPQECTLGQRNDLCTSNSECCSGVCKRNGRCR